MSLKLEQIEHFEYLWKQTSDKPWKVKSHSRKKYKNQRNRKIRRVNKEEVPNIKYKGWEY